MEEEQLRLLRRKSSGSRKRHVRRGATAYLERGARIQKYGEWAIAIHTLIKGGSLNKKNKPIKGKEEEIKKLWQADGSEPRQRRSRFLGGGVNLGKGRTVRGGKGARGKTKHL